jgi:hypothetical protein
VKLLIAGSRTIAPSIDYICSCVRDEAIITRIVSGGARGVDTAAIAYAKYLGIPCTIFIPGWGLHTRRYAAFVRNNDMAAYADALLAIWDGSSKGTKHMIDAMRELGKPVRVVAWK